MQYKIACIILKKNRECNQSNFNEETSFSSMLSQIDHYPKWCFLMKILGYLLEISGTLNTFKLVYVIYFIKCLVFQTFSDPQMRFFFLKKLLMKYFLVDSFQIHIAALMDNNFSCSVWINTNATIILAA